MGLIVSEVYDALIEAGTSPEKATAAAAAVPLAENMATSDDIAGIDANIAGIRAEIARIDANIAEIRATMVTQDDLTGVRAEMAKIGTDIAVLKLAVFGGGSVMLGAIGTLLKLALFP